MHILTTGSFRAIYGGPVWLSRRRAYTCGMAIYSIETQGQLESHLSQEWLLTIWFVGFAAGTVVGCNTRRYHGLLCGATLPPLGRVMALSRIGEIILRKDARLEFSVNQFE